MTMLRPAFSHFSPWSLGAPIALAAILLAASAHAQTTNNTNTGATQKLTMTVTNTHGINTSASMTPDFDVVTYAKLVIKPDGSSSFQSAGDGAAAAMNRICLPRGSILEL